MKKRFQWFTLYPGHPKASNLSILSGGVKLVSLLLLIGAALASLPCWPWGCGWPCWAGWAPP